MNRQKLIATLIRAEGIRLLPYTDTTGHATIGVGHEIQPGESFTLGITQDEAMEILTEDINKVVNNVSSVIACYALLSDVRQRVLIEMAFNMGLGGLLEFHDTLHAISLGNYAMAAQFMMHSLWAKEVPERAQRLSTMMASGEDPTP
jgi:lysozyme